jgi:hypothetical protein
MDRPVRCAFGAVLMVLLAACAGCARGSSKTASANRQARPTGSVFPHFTRRTAQGVRITFATNDFDPLIRRVTERLRQESAFEQKYGRQAMSPRCEPTRAYRVILVSDGVHVDDNGSFAAVQPLDLQGGVHVAYPTKATNQVVWVPVHARDRRVFKIRLEVDGTTDAQQTVDGWATLAVVTPRRGVPGDVDAVHGTITAVARDGTTLAIRALPTPSYRDPCLPPFLEPTG